MFHNEMSKCIIFGVMQAPAADKSKEEKDEVDESKFDEFMGNDAGTFHTTFSV